MGTFIVCWKRSTTSTRTQRENTQRETNWLEHGELSGQTSYNTKQKSVEALLLLLLLLQEKYFETGYAHDVGKKKFA